MHDESGGTNRFKFVTKDGAVSAHPETNLEFERKEISPKNAQITEIKVRV